MSFWGAENTLVVDSGVADRVGPDALGGVEELGTVVVRADECLLLKVDLRHPRFQRAMQGAEYMISTSRNAVYMAPIPNPAHSCACDPVSAPHATAHAWDISDGRIRLILRW